MCAMPRQCLPTNLKVWAVGVPYDLEGYWTQLYLELTGGDHAVSTLLVFRGDGDADRQGAGFDRVRAFREGVINGAESCLDYEN